MTHATLLLFTSGLLGLVDSSETIPTAGRQAIHEARARRKEHSRLFDDMGRAVACARIRNTQALLSWLKTQKYPDDFKEEVRARIDIATAATELAWSEMHKSPKAANLNQEVDAFVPKVDLVVALRRIGRSNDAKSLAKKQTEKLIDPPSNKLSEKEKIQALVENLSEASLNLGVVEWLCEAEDRAWAEQVLHILQKRKIPLGSRRQRREIYRRVGNLQADQGDLEAALATHKLADDLVEPNEWEDERLLGPLASTLIEKLGVEKALERARGISLALEEEIVNINPPQGPDRATKLKQAEEGYWRILPRLAEKKEVRIGPEAFVWVAHTDGEFAHAERVLERALATRPVRLGDNVAEHVLSHRTWKRPESVDRLAALLLRLAEADATWDAGRRASLKLDVALVKAKIDRRHEARELAEEARFLLRDRDYRFELLDLLLGSPQSTYARIEYWMKNGDELAISNMLVWELPEEVLREFLLRIERIQSSRNVPSEATKNRMIAILSAELGDVDRAKTALRAVFQNEAESGVGLSQRLFLEEFAWELVRELKTTEKAAMRCEAAVELATQILRQQLGIY